MSILQGRALICIALGFLGATSTAHATNFDSDDLTDATVAYRLPLISVAHLDDAPAIDGTIDPQEWGQATLVRGLHTQAGYLGGSGIMHEDMAVIWLGYDHEAFYVAFDTERPAHARVPKADYVPDGTTLTEKEVWQDDHVEIVLQPPGKPLYHFAVNAQGNHGEGILRASTDRSWNGVWQSQAQLTERGWQFEARIPFGTLEGAHPSHNTVWPFMVMRGRKTPEKSIASLSYLTGWPNPQEYARILFAPPDQTVVRTEQFGAIDLEKVGVQLELTPPQQDQELLIEASVYRKRDDVITFKGENKLDKDEDILIPVTMDWAFYQTFLPDGWQAALETTSKVKSWREHLVLPAGQAWNADWTVKAPDGKYVGTYTVQDVRTGRLLTARALPFEKKNPLQLSISPWVLMANEIRIEVAYDGSIVNDPAMELDIQVADDATGNELFNRSTTVDLGDQQDLFILPAHPYLGKSLRVTASLNDPDGKQISQANQTVAIPEKPQWLGNDYGLSHEVPAPWTPIELSGNQAHVLLRRYQMDNAGFPKQITSLDQPLLARPITLQHGGQAINWEPDEVTQSPDKVIWRSSTEIDGCELELTSQLEYDGMIRYDLTLAPTNSKVTVQDIELAIPYRTDRNIEKLPIRHAAFEPLVQLGDFETGLCWAAEWAKGWQIGSKPAIEAYERGETIDWRIRFFGSEGKTLIEPLTITWLLQALPVRPWNTTYRDLRALKHLGSEPDVFKPETLPPGMTENSLTYPVPDNLLPDAGSISFQLLPSDTLNMPEIQVLQIKGSRKPLTLVYERKPRRGDRWPFKQTLALYHGKREIARVFPIMRQLDTPWLPVALSWVKDDKQTEVTLMTVNAKNDLVTGTGHMNSSDWQACFRAEHIRFGGEQTIGIDDVCFRKTPLNPLAYADQTAAPATLDESVLLLDALDQFYFHRGHYLSRPRHLQNGKGGVIGATLLSSFVQKIDGRFGGAVLLPAGHQRDVHQYARSLGVKLAFPNHGQWQGMCGYYSPTFVPDPVLQDRWHHLRDLGLGVVTYTGFAFDPEWDPMIGPYMDELARRPIVKIYTGWVPCRATPVVDYYTWGLKQAIDYYGVQGLHLDATWDCKNPCLGDACACKWTDEHGKHHGRHTILANRAMAQRFYGLMKSYRLEQYGAVGYLGLHSGASEYPMVAAFADVCKHGEGGAFTSSEFAQHPMLPEAFDLLVTSRRMGVPAEILTKGDNMPYGPNFLYLYTLLFDMGLRTQKDHLYPAYWHMDFENPTPIRAYQSGRHEKLPPFNPYGAKPDISNYPLPTALLWMLMDDFGCAQARFIPFWRIASLIQPDHDQVRCSAWLRPGESALMIVGNFSGAAVQTSLQVDWDAMGLDSRGIEVFDAWTGEAYDWSPAGIDIAFSEGPYRLIRIEKKPF